MTNKHGQKTYTYLIGWSRLDTWYYGSRIANKKSPCDDLMHEYKTSSSYVKWMIEFYGEPDIIQIRRTFDDVTSPLMWEETVLRRLNCVKSNRWLNRNNAGKYFSRSNTYVMSNTTKAKISDSLKGKKRPEFSDEWKKNLSDSKIGLKYPGKGSGRKFTAEHKQRLSDSAKLSHLKKPRGQHPNSKAAARVAGLGTKRNEEQKQRMRDAWKLRPPAQQVICPWCAKEGAVSIMKRWHFENCKDKL